MFPSGETITVTREGAPTGAYDAAGNPVLSASVDSPITDVGVAPLTPQESIEIFGAMNIGGYTLYLPEDADLRSTDSITVRGEPGYQVQGDAGLVEWRSPFTGWNPGQVAIVRRAS